MGQQAGVKKMTLFDKDHYDLMDQFEKLFRREGRMDREAKDQWAKGYIYQHGEINRLFNAFRHGYALGQAVERT